MSEKHADIRRAIAVFRGNDLKLPRVYRDQEGREVFAYSKESFQMLADQVSAIVASLTAANSSIAASAAAATADSPALAPVVTLAAAVATVAAALQTSLTPAPAAPTA
jgi:hypothetical protein